MLFSKPANSLILRGLIGLTIAVAVAQAQKIDSDSTNEREMNHSLRMREMNNEILRLHDEMQQISPERWESIRDEAAPVLEQRFAALSQMVQRNPGEGLKFAFSAELIDDLATKFPQLVSRIEKHGAWQGPVERRFYDYADPQSSREVLIMKV